MTQPDATPRTILDFIRVTAEHFKKNAVDDARLEAELLLAHAIGTNRVGLYVNYDRPLTTDEVIRFRELVKRRGRHEPVAYILGTKEFWSLAFEVGAGILVPRPDTECLVEEALVIAKALAPGLAGRILRIADVGTGSGAIAIALAKELPQAEVWAGDVADEPLAYAPRNAARHGVAERVHVVRATGLGPLAEAAGAPFDLVCSNPPYIREADFEGLPRHVRQAEPRVALVAGVDGLDVLRTLALDAARPEVIAVGGGLVLEIGDPAQAAALEALLAPRFAAVRVRADYAGLPRVVVATGARA